MVTVKKVLGQETLVSSILRDNSVLVEVGGSVRRIKVDDFMNALNAGDEQLLRQVAWGIPIKQDIQSSTNYGRIGNLTAWQEYKLQSGRYLVTNAGKAAKLHPNNSDSYVDGTMLDESKGHVMHISPRLYFRVQTDSVTGLPVLWMSQLPIGGHYIGNAHGGMYNVMGAYKGSISGTALVSRSGVAPTGSRTIQSFWDAARVNGTDWGLINVDLRKLMIMFGLSEYGDTNIQAKLGYGIGGSAQLDLWGAAAVLLIGATKSLGDNFGNIPIDLVNGANTGVDCSRVNLMGIEDPYNWQWEMSQGAYFGSSANAGQTGSEIYLYEGNRLPSASELTATPSGSYRQLTRPTTSNYIQKIILGEYFDTFPSLLGGNSTSYWADYFYGNTTGQLCLWGGTAYHGSSSGLAYVDSTNVFSSASSLIGARLAYYGMLNFVNGKDI